MTRLQASNVLKKRPWRDGVAEIKKTAMGECISWRKTVVGHGGCHAHGAMAVHGRHGGKYRPTLYFFSFFFLKTSEDILARMKQGHASKPAVPMSNMQTTRTWRRRLSEACLFLPQLSNFRPFDATATQVELRWTANSFSDRHCAAMALLQSLFSLSLIARCRCLCFLFFSFFGTCCM